MRNGCENGTKIYKNSIQNGSKIYAKSMKNRSGIPGGSQERPRRVPCRKSQGYVKAFDDMLGEKGPPRGGFWAIGKPKMAPESSRRVLTGTWDLQKYALGGVPEKTRKSDGFWTGKREVFGGPNPPKVL